ncbi:MAG: EamA family transporter, partial [Actinomycetota bacterium]
MSLAARPDEHAPAWLVWTALWVVYLMWGSTYLAIRILVETIPPLLGAGVRFIAAGLIMHAVLFVRRGPRGASLSLKELGAATLVGALLLLGGNGLVTVAEQEVPSGLAALIVASVPLWVVLLRAVFRDRVGRPTLLATLVGFVGVAILVLPGGGSGDVSLGGLLTVVAASTFWAAGSFLSKYLPLPDDPFRSTAVQMLAGGVVTVLMALVVGESRGLEMSDLSAASIWAFVYLVFAGSLFAFTAYTWLLQHAPISKVATYAYVNPVVAIFLGWLILDELISPAIALGATVIV